MNWVKSRERKPKWKKSTKKWELIPNCVGRCCSLEGTRRLAFSVFELNCILNEQTKDDLQQVSKKLEIVKPIIFYKNKFKLRRSKLSCQVIKGGKIENFKVTFDLVMGRSNNTWHSWKGDGSKEQCHQISQGGGRGFANYVPHNIFQIFELY